MTSEVSTFENKSDRHLDLIEDIKKLKKEYLDNVIYWTKKFSKLKTQNCKILTFRYILGLEIIDIVGETGLSESRIFSIIKDGIEEIVKIENQ